MGVLQSIDSAREENVGPHGVKADALKAALTRAEGALESVNSLTGIEMTKAGVAGG